MKYAPYSYSKLNLFTACPFAWKLKYIDKIKEPQSEEAKFGELLHFISSLYVKHLIENRIKSNELYLAELKNGYREKYPEVVNIPFKISLEEPDQIENYGIEEFIAIDHEGKPVHPEKEEALLRGKIDFYYQTKFQKAVNEITIIDWKTNLPSTLDKKQLAVYAILLAFRFPEVQVFNIKFHCLKDGRKIQAKVNREELRPTWEWICELVDRIENTNQFPPTPGSHCQWCGYLTMGLCPLSKEVPVPPENTKNPVKSVKFPEIKIPQTPEEAVKLASLLRICDILRDRIREALRPWCKKNGPIKLNDKAFGIWEKESVKWKSVEAKEKLVHELLEAGISREEVWGILDISKSSLEKLLKRYRKDHILPELEKLGEVTRSSRLEWKTL